MRRLLLVALSIGLASTALGAPSSPAGPLAERQTARSAHGFRGSVEELSPRLRRRMTGASWHEGCPVGLGDLRLVRATHIGFDGRPDRGSLVVHERYARGMLGLLRRLWAKRFPIRRMELIDRFGGDDHRSMAADNTSAFNCRFVNGTTRWSQHAYGEAVDINPRENPYVSGSFVSPPEGRPFADRSPRRRGMISAGDLVTNSLRAHDRVGLGRRVGRADRLPALLLRRYVTGGCGSPSRLMILSREPIGPRWVEARSASDRATSASHSGFGGGETDEQSRERSPDRAGPGPLDGSG